MPSRRWPTERSRRVEALDVAGRREVQRTHRDLLGLGGLVADAERARQRAVDERVLEQVLGEAAERLLALGREAVANAV